MINLVNFQMVSLVNFWMNNLKAILRLTFRWSIGEQLSEIWIHRSTLTNWRRLKCMSVPLNNCRHRYLLVFLFSVKLQQRCPSLRAQRLFCILKRLSIRLHHRANVFLSFQLLCLTVPSWLYTCGMSRSPELIFVPFFSIMMVERMRSVEQIDKRMVNTNMSESDYSKCSLMELTQERR